MSRKPRVFSQTDVYHVILRSVNQHIIFEEDYDYQKFLFILSDCKKKYNVEVCAYCLMNNHIHILIKSPSDVLSNFFQSLETIFVRWYNNKYKRSGHLFQDRFHSYAVEDMGAFLSVIYYMHNNPVKANICRFQSEYRWSSVCAYYGQKNLPVDTYLAEKIAGSKRQLQQYFKACPDPSSEGPFKNDHKEKRFFLTDDQALEIFKSVTNLPSTSAVVNIIRSQRNEYVRVLKAKGLTIKQISRVMDISDTTVKRLCREAP